MTLIYFLVMLFLVIFSIGVKRESDLMRDADRRRLNSDNFKPDYSNSPRKSSYCFWIHYDR